MQEPLNRESGSKTLDALTNMQPLHYIPLQHLGMAKKAGLLAIGSDAVKSAAMSGKVKLVAITTDISEGSAKQARYYAEDSNAVFIETPYNKFEFGRVVGRGSPGVLAILDAGLAEGFMKKLTDLDSNRYSEQKKIIENVAKKAKKITYDTKKGSKKTGKRKYHRKGGQANEWNTNV